MQAIKNKYLIAILFVAAVLRLWNLGNIPPSLTQDEASLGYNAYSILKTGKDEYGSPFPAVFKSFGDYKPGLYVYLDTPFIAVFGLNEVSVRLPSAIFGILTVLLVYLIAERLFRPLGNLSAFIAATNPWLIYYSRGAWEANVSLTLTLAAIYFFLRALNSSKYLVPSAGLFALTLLTYQGAKLSSVIAATILLFIYRKEILKIERKYLFGGIILGIIVAAPIVFSLFNGQAGRLDVFSVFSYPRSKEYTQAFLDEGGEKLGSFGYYTYHSEALNFTRGILGRYFNHFSGRFLFFDGDYQNPQHSAPYQGMLLISDLLLVVFGLAYLVKNLSINSKGYFLVLAWLLFSPLPAVLSRDQVQSVRALNMAIPLVMILSFGLYSVLSWIKERKLSLFFYVFTFGVYLAAFVYFLDAYFIHVPNHNSQYWNYGYKQVVEKVSAAKPDFKQDPADQSPDEKIIVEQSYAQPYIYFLFFQKYDPAKYQRQAKLTETANSSDVGLVERLENIKFLKIDWSQIRSQKGALVIVNGTTSIPDDLSHLKVDKINYLNGRDPAFEIIRIE